MIIVVMALLPCFIFGMYNTGYQHWLAAGEQSMPFWSLMLYGFLAVIPRVVVCYLVGLGIEFIVAQWRKEEIQEGFLCYRYPYTYDMSDRDTCMDVGCSYRLLCDIRQGKCLAAQDIIYSILR